MGSLEAGRKGLKRKGLGSGRSDRWNWEVQGVRVGGTEAAGKCGEGSLPPEGALEGPEQVGPCGPLKGAWPLSFDHCKPLEVFEPRIDKMGFAYCIGQLGSLSFIQQTMVAWTL